MIHKPQETSHVGAHEHSRVGNDPLFGAAFEYAAIGMALISIYGLWIKVNSRFSAITGYSRQELVQTEVRRIMHADDITAHSGLMRQLYEGEISSVQVETRLIHKNGFTFWSVLSLSLVRDLLGNPLYYVAQFEDITQRKQMERQLEESEQRYKSLIQHNQAGIVTSDLSGVITDVNPAMERILGYESAEMLGKPFALFLQDMKDQESLTLLLRESENMILTVRHRSGELIELGLKQVPIIVNQQITGFYMIARDITQHNKDRELQRLAQIELKKTVQWQHGMTFKYKEKDGVFIHTFCDGEMVYRDGHQPSDFIEKQLIDFLPEHLALEKEPYYRRAWEGEENVCYEYSWDGVTYFATLRPIRENGKVIEVIGSCVDITERKRMETELRETKDLLESFINNTTDAICVLDLHARVISVNTAYEHIFGWKKEELIGRELPIYPKFLLDEHDAIYTSLRAGKQISGLETVRIHKDGKLIDVSETKTPVKNERGEIIAFAGITRDITERKKTEEMLRRSEKLSVAGQLAAGLAHEIRNPLTSLRGFLQLLQSDLPGKQHYFDIMLSELDRINFIVSEFLVIARPEALQYKYNDIKEIIQSVIALLETQALLCGVQLELELLSEVPTLICSEMHLKQLFINVIKNAMEATPGEGLIQLQVSMQDETHVLIRCIDNGMGIPAERLAKLGEPFYTTKEKGTGLGLMMCFKIVEAHQGVMQISSELGKGTKIDILLPVETDLTPIE